MGSFENPVGYDVVCSWQSSPAANSPCDVAGSFPLRFEGMFLVENNREKWQRKKSSPAGNRTRVFRVTGGDTYHYTTEDVLDLLSSCQCLTLCVCVCVCVSSSCGYMHVCVCWVSGGRLGIQCLLPNRLWSSQSSARQRSWSFTGSCSTHCWPVAAKTLASE